MGICQYFFSFCGEGSPNIRCSLYTNGKGFFNQDHAKQTNDIWNQMLKIFKEFPHSDMVS